MGKLRCCKCGTAEVKVYYSGITNKNEFKSNYGICGGCFKTIRKQHKNILNNSMIQIYEQYYYPENFNHSYYIFDKSGSKKLIYRNGTLGGVEGGGGVNHIKGNATNSELNEYFLNILMFLGVNGLGTKYQDSYYGKKYSLLTKNDFNNNIFGVFDPKEKERELVEHYNLREINQHDKRSDINFIFGDGDISIAYLRKNDVAAVIIPISNRSNYFLNMNNSIFVRDHSEPKNNVNILETNYYQDFENCL